MIHAAIQEAAAQEGLPQFYRAFVQIEVTTPRGSNNHQLWDTCNRAVNLVINNLKGIFFWDDDLEHMAFSVVGAWAKQVAQPSESPVFGGLDPSKATVKICVFHELCKMSWSTRERMAQPGLDRLEW